MKARTHARKQTGWRNTRRRHAKAFHAQRDNKQQTEHAEHSVDQESFTGSETLQDNSTLHCQTCTKKTKATQSENAHRIRWPNNNTWRHGLQRRMACKDGSLAKAHGLQRRIACKGASLAKAHCLQRRIAVEPNMVVLWFFARPLTARVRMLGAYFSWCKIEGAEGHAQKIGIEHGWLYRWCGLPYRLLCTTSVHLPVSSAFCISASACKGAWLAKGHGLQRCIVCKGASLAKAHRLRMGIACQGASPAKAPRLQRRIAGKG